MQQQRIKTYALTRTVYVLLYNFLWWPFLAKNTVHDRCYASLSHCACMKHIMMKGSHDMSLKQVNSTVHHNWNTT